MGGAHHSWEVVSKDAVIRRSFPAHHHGGGPAPPSAEELHPHQFCTVTSALWWFLTCPEASSRGGAASAGTLRTPDSADHTLHT